MLPLWAGLLQEAGVLGDASRPRQRYHSQPEGTSGPGQVTESLGTVGAYLYSEVIPTAPGSHCRIAWGTKEIGYVNLLYKYRQVRMRTP